MTQGRSAVREQNGTMQGTLRSRSTRIGNGDADTRRASPCRSQLGKSDDAGFDLRGLSLRRDRMRGAEKDDLGRMPGTPFATGRCAQGRGGGDRLGVRPTHASAPPRAEVVQTSRIRAAGRGGAGSGYGAGNPSGRLGHPGREDIRSRRARSHRQRLGAEQRRLAGPHLSGRGSGRRSYPHGQDWDICREAADARISARIAAVPLPVADPIDGTEGPLPILWRRNPSLSERGNAGAAGED